MTYSPMAKADAENLARVLGAAACCTWVAGAVESVALRSVALVVRDGDQVHRARAVLSCCTQIVCGQACMWDSL